MVNLEQLQSFMKRQVEEDRKQSYVNVSGTSLQDALKQASIELGLPVKKIEYEVLERGSQGLLGVGKKPCIILAYPARAPQAGLGTDEFPDLDFSALAAERGNPNQDGEVFVRLSSQGVLLKVTAPRGNGVPATERQAVEMLSSRSAGQINKGMVAKVVKLAEGEFVRVGDYDHNPSNDAILSLEIADMEMKAYLTALPPGPGGADPAFDTIIAFLEQNGVVEGINSDAVAGFIDRPQYKVPFVVAEGIPPKNGADARVVYNFQTDPTKVKLKEVNGRVDFKELNLVQNVVEGQVLARKIPAERGEAGRTVTGKLLPAKDGKDFDIDVGKNIRLSEDKMTAVAEMNGQVILSGGRIHVEPVYTVAGDVNLKTGHVLFLGTVLVKGNVEDGFEVKAAGNIEVMGSVGKCNLDAEGDIIVHQGITGKSAGVIKAGKSVWSKFIENSRVEAGELVVVSDGIINSEVFANRRIICKGKRAAIVGGKLRASEEINAKTLGSVAGMETYVEVGYDPHSKEHLVALQKRDGEITAEQGDIALNMKTLEHQLRAKKELPKDKVASYNDLKQRKVTLMAEQKKLREEIAGIHNYLNQLKFQGKISASGTVFPGVRISIKDAMLEVRNEFKGVTFVSEGGTVKVTKYEESDEDISMMNRRG
ncbi:FapA family protein [Salinispira pacifica]